MYVKNNLFNRKKEIKTLAVCANILTFASLKVSNKSQ